MKIFRKERYPDRRRDIYLFDIKILSYTKPFRLHLGLNPQIIPCGLNAAGGGSIADKSISIIVPVYNALDEVKLLMSSLSQTSFDANTEILLIDDCSGVETATYLSEFACGKHQFSYIKNDENLGFVQTCNRGIDLAKNDIVVLLNSDTMVPDNFENAIINCMNADKNIACASPIGTCTRWFDIRVDTLDELNDKNKKLGTPKYPAFTPEGFCFVCRKSILEKIGKLDTAFGRGYCEEDDLVLRAISSGYNTVLIDNLIVYHKRNASFGAEQRQAQHRRNNSIFGARWGNQQEYIHRYVGIYRLVDEINHRHGL